MDSEHRTPSGGTVAHCTDDTACTRLSCAVCLKEVPADAVHVTDAQDYVHHFCGLECLAAWQKQAGVETPPVPANPVDRIK